MTDQSTVKSRKMLYSMGEVCEMFDVNPSLIRFWEKKFAILHPKKNAKGNRLFTVEDIENLKIIYHLVKERGMTLTGAEQHLRENRAKLGKSVGLIDILQNVRSVLVELRQELDSQAELQEEQQNGQTTGQVVIMSNSNVSSVSDSGTGSAVTDISDSANFSSEDTVTSAEATAKPRYIEQTLF